MIEDAAEKVEIIERELPPIPLSAAHWQLIASALKLSPRQAEVLELIVRGAALHEISAMLNISISTIRTQQQRILDKAGAGSRWELMLRILELSHSVGRCERRQI